MTTVFVGAIKKMRVENTAPVNYFFRIGVDEIYLNPWLNQSITMEFLNQIFCIQCGRKTNKSFQQGYCFPCLRRFQECHLCIIHPERCQVQQGHCSPNDWAHQQCHQEHIIYLANSSGLKVGITRTNPGWKRWIDQGAIQALPIMTVSNRYLAGCVEVILKKYVADKTAWQKMLHNKNDFIDLYASRQQLLQQSHDELQLFFSDALKGEYCLLNELVSQFDYPINAYPEKMQTLSLEKSSKITDVLLGMKGQYLLLKNGVINIRKYGGYQLRVTLES